MLGFSYRARLEGGEEALEELTATPDNSPKMRANDAKLNFMVNGIVTSQRDKSNDVVLCGNEIGWWLVLLAK